MSEIRNSFWRMAAEYGIIAVSTWIMMAGIYLFKFPSHFTFRGVIGFPTIVNGVSRWPASDSTLIVDTSLLILGFIFLSKGFGIKIVYASMVVPINLSLLERVCLLNKPLATEPLLELLFAILLLAAGTAILFNLGVSNGGTDIVAIMLKKYTSLNIGTALMLMDMATATSSFFIFGPETGPFSAIGLVAKSLVIDDVIENLNLCKCFSTTCDDPEPTYGYIINMLYRSATAYHAEGAFTHHERTVIMTTTRRSQASKLRSYIHAIGPTVFMLISNPSKVIGKGLLTEQAQLRSSISNIKITAAQSGWPQSDSLPFFHSARFSHRLIPSRI